MVAFDSKDDYFLIDNASDGVDLFSLLDPTLIRHFPTGTRSVRYAVQVAFGEQGGIVVSGSDCGLVYVFRLEDGQEICSLRHKWRGMVQCVTVSVSRYVERSSCSLTLSRPISLRTPPSSLQETRFPACLASSPYGIAA